MRGTCSECGLEFAWRDLLDPRFAAVPILFEHAENRLLRSFRITFLRCLRPWSFWRWIRLEHPIVHTRLRVFGPLALALAQILAAATLLLIAWIVSKFSTSVEPWSALVPFAPDVWLTWGWYRRGYAGDCWGLSLLGATVAVAVCPLWLLVFRDSFRLARVRRAHIQRIWAYTLVWTPMPCFVGGLLAVCMMHIQGLWSPVLLGPIDVGSVLLDFGGVAAAVISILGVAMAIGCSVSNYLRLPGAWLVSVAVWAVTLTLAATVAVLAWFPYAELFLR